MWLAASRQARRPGHAERGRLSRSSASVRRESCAHGSEERRDRLPRGRGCGLLRQIVECVPNFSEGRDATVVARIAQAIAQVPGAAVLGQTSDCDHNRSVITFAGAPAAVAEAAFRGIESAVALIDMNRHDGVHPRVGAADVVPLVPVAGATIEDCVRLAEYLGERVWRELRVPVYLYEVAARRPDRVN